jgi:four helix bundle protein
MFDFQKLSVYHKAKAFSIEISKLLRSKKFDRTTNDQLRRASFSIMLNIAESASRFSNKDRRNFLVIARGSVFECIAILEFLSETQGIEKKVYQEYFLRLEEISKMLFGLIKKLS